MKNLFYQVEDDSKLLLNCILSDLKNNEFLKLKKDFKICEMGVGSGYIINEIAMNFKNTNFNKNIKYYGFDINVNAIENTKKEFKKINEKIELKKSDLFKENKIKTFDIILFNTPYLPLEEGENYPDLKVIDKALYGGKNGYEITIIFLTQITNLINEDSIVYILISTLTNNKIVESKINELNLKFKIIGKKKEFFEELLVYKIYR